MKNLNKGKNMTRTEQKKEIMKKLKQAKNVFVWCVIDTQDVGHYIKASKTDLAFWVKKYLKDNTNLDNIYNSLDLRLDEHTQDLDLYVN
jgi:ribosomal protein L39E